MFLIDFLVSPPLRLSCLTLGTLLCFSSCLSDFSSLLFAPEVLHFSTASLLDVFFSLPTHTAQADLKSDLDYHICVISSTRFCVPDCRPVPSECFCLDILQYLILNMCSWFQFMTLSPSVSHTRSLGVSRFVVQVFSSLWTEYLLNLSSLFLSPLTMFSLWS